MLGKIKLYAIAGLGFLTAILYALFNREKAARAADKLKASEKRAEVQGKAVDSLTSGLTREENTRHETVDTSRRDHFE